MLEREVVSASEEERQRTARDLHDGLASLLTGVDYRVQAVAKDLSRLDLPQAGIQTISQLIRDAIGQTRAISKGLHPVGPHPEDLKNALKALASQVASASSATCRFRCDAPVPIDNPKRANQLFRIAQEAVNNAIKHSNATRITLSLAKNSNGLILKITDNGSGFNPASRNPKAWACTSWNTDPAPSALDYLKNKSGPIWHCRIPKEKLDGARYYAYRVAGPPPETGFEWHRFDSEKLLLDPYASSVYFPPAFDREAAMAPGCNAGGAPLALLQDVRCDCAFDWEGNGGTVRHDADLVIYEMHVRGFTRHPSCDVPDGKRGTFAGVIEKIPDPSRTGITAVELMPVFQFDPDEGNYWGYNPLNFFSPHHAYAGDPFACQQHDEFREMVRALHAAGIEVILDVVYNHTAEGD